MTLLLVADFRRGPKADMAEASLISDLCIAKDELTAAISTQLASTALCWGIKRQEWRMARLTAIHPRKTCAVSARNA